MEQDLGANRDLGMDQDLGTNWDLGIEQESFERKTVL